MPDPNAFLDTSASPPPEQPASLSGQFPNSGRSPRRPTWRAAVSWCFIVATVTLTQLPHYRDLQAPSNASAGDVSLQLTGRYMVGMKHFFQSIPAFHARTHALAQSLQKYRDTPSQLLVVPIMAELSGKDAALAELQRITQASAHARAAGDARLFQQLYRDGAASLNPEQRRAIARYGWIGQLALSQDSSDAHPSRKAILAAATRTVIAVIVFILAAAAAVAAGMILLVLAIVLRAKGRLGSRLMLPQNPGISLLEAFAIYLTGFLGVPAATAVFFPDLRLGAGILAVLAVPAALLWPMLGSAKWSDYRLALGLHRGRGILREIGAGIAGYLAGLPLLLAAAAVVAVLARFAGGPPTHPIQYEIGRGPMHLLFWSMLASIWAPVVEETFFRGMLFGYLRRFMPWAATGIATAFLFAIMHPQGWIGAPLLMAIGFTLGTIREWRGSIIASMSAHALNNCMVLLLVVFALA